MSCRQVVGVLAVVAAGIGFTGAAHAEDWGKIEDAQLCDKEWATANASPDLWKWFNEAFKTGKGISPECKAELDKRIKACLKDDSMSTYFNQRGSDPNEICSHGAFSGMQDQVSAAKAAKKRDEDVAKASEAEHAKIAAATAARELPKATKHDAKLEKAVADAYRRNYPDNKILKILLGNWAEEYEKDAFNRVTGRDLDATVVEKEPDGKCYLHNEYWMQRGSGKSFSGPLSPRGAGSLNKDEILCNKVEGKK